MKIGLIYNLEDDKHILFKSYYHSISSFYKNIKKINDLNDLSDIKMLFIGDEHFIPHRKVWKNINFINRCNNLNIKVVIFNNEKIMDSDFPWNEENQGYINKFNNVYQYVSDIDDVIKLNKRFNRMPPSKYIKNFINNIDVNNKMNKAIFIGNIQYKNRCNILNSINSIIETDIIESSINMSWGKYINKLSKYKFVISPFGNAHFFPMRFYEILLVKSIPIQEIKHNTLQYYDIESKYDDCIFFENILELDDKINNFKLDCSHNMLWLEDNMEILLKESGLL